MVLGKQDLFRSDSHLFPDNAFDPEFFRKPVFHRFTENSRGTRVGIDDRFHDPVQFAERFFMKDHVFQVIGGDPGKLQAKRDRPGGEGIIMFFAAEAFLFRGAEQDPVLDQGGRGIMVKARYSQDIH